MAHGRRVILWIGGLAALSCAAADPESGLGAAPHAPADSLIRRVIEPVPRAPKPARFDSLQQRLDYLHDTLYNDYNTRIERADAYFGRAQVEPEQPEPSRFRLRLAAELIDEDAPRFSFKPSFDARIKLPNVEARWNVFLNTRRPGTLPGTDPTDEDSALRLGMAAFLRHVPVSAGAGVRLAWLPTAFAELVWGPEWTLGGWTLIPSQALFYETDDRLGEQSHLAAYRWFGNGRQWIVGSVAAATWSQASDGLEWETTLKTVWVQAMLEEQRRGRDVDRGDLARGLGARVSLFGSDRLATEYRTLLTLRRPVYRDWIFLDINPGFKWRRTREWRTDPFLLAGLEWLFWGSPAR